MDHLIYQYSQVKSSRQVVTDYCRTISADDFTRTNSSFGKGSIRNLLVHIANCYEYWIGNCCLKNNIAPTQYDLIKTIDESVDLFFSVDNLMIELFNSPILSYDNIMIERLGKKLNVHPLKLVTHAMTHEFHHKGQIMSLSRHLGYSPVDTDIMR